MKIDLAALLSNASARMAVDLNDVKTASGHAGLKGAGAEEILAEFLASRLPKSLGVTTGHIVDSSGNLSKQEDVIIYDSGRTPILFESALGGWNVVPAEGVLAAIEVKMDLQASQLESIVENCQSVQELDRSAYVGPPDPRFNLHGQAWSEMPIIYSVFAFTGDNLYASRLNQLQSEVPVHQRIASVCVLDRGLNMGVEFDLPASNFSPWPTTIGLADIETEDCLALWFTGLCAALFQAEIRPLDLLKYMPSEMLRISGSVQHDDLEYGKKWSREAAAHASGVSKDVVDAIFDGIPLSDEQRQQMLAKGWLEKPGPGGGWTRPQ